MAQRSFQLHKGGKSRGRDSYGRSASGRIPRDFEERRRRAYASGAPEPSRRSRPASSAVAQAALPVSSSRVGVIAILFAVCCAVFFLRLVYLQVIVADEYTAMAQEARTVTIPVQAQRGTIYDRNGVVLATSVESTTIYANPSEIEDPHQAARVLAVLLDGKYGDYYDLLQDRSSTFAYLKRQADKDVAQKVREEGIRGVYFLTEYRREYPQGAIGGQVVGFCDADGNGIAGLELQYNDILSGQPGTYVAERGEQGFPIPGGASQENAAVDGQDIVVSLDVKLQDSVEQALAEGLVELETKEGSAVIMDASTGEIHAICSLPYMDPSDMKHSTVGSDQVKPITRSFEPGSVFKAVSLLSVLEHGVLTPEDEIFCPSTLTANEYVVSDSHDREPVTYSLREILAHSSNVGTSLAVEKMGFLGLNEAIARYRFTETTGIDFPGEASGTVLGFDKWARITGYNISFGQGIQITPLHIVRFYAILLNDGVMVQPHFLVQNLSTGQVPEYAREKVMKNEQAMTDMRSMLRSVVTDGTGVDADVEGYKICGKTSTAEIAEGASYKKDVYNLAFCGFIDDSSSDLVCFVGANEVYGMRQVTKIFGTIMEHAIEQYNITSLDKDE